MVRRITSFRIVCVSFLLLCQISSNAANSIPANSSEQSTAGYGFEVMMAKLDYLQYKLHEMELGRKERDEEVAEKRKERDEEVTEKLTKLENSLTDIQGAINRLDRDAGHNLTVLSAQSRKMIAQQTACANHEQMRKEIAQLSSNTTDTAKYMNWYKQQQLEIDQLSPNATDSANDTTVQLLSNKTSSYLKGPFKSCKEAPAGKTGVYWIQLDENQPPFEAFCEQNNFGGGWLVIQYRFNGALDFNRDWAEYANGFGSLNQEFWFGLEKIHQLTTRKPHELAVEMRDFSQNYKYARYDQFEVGNSTEQYALKKVESYSGTASDSLTHAKGRAFYTKDRDTYGAIARGKGGRWYAGNHFNLNGRYINKDDQSSMYWYSYPSQFQGLAYSRMMIRETQT